MLSFLINSLIIIIIMNIIRYEYSDCSKTIKFIIKWHKLFPNSQYHVWGYCLFFVCCELNIARVLIKHLFDWEYLHTTVMFYKLSRTWYKSMMTSSNGNIFRVTGPLCGEFTGPGEFPTQRPVTRSFDVFFDLRLNKRLSKQPWGWWFETRSWSLWRQCSETTSGYMAVFRSG